MMKINKKIKNIIRINQYLVKKIYKKNKIKI